MTAASQSSLGINGKPTGGSTVSVVLDGTPRGERVLPYATRLASSSGSSLLLLSVLSPQSGKSAHEMQHYLEVTAECINDMQQSFVRTSVSKAESVSHAVLGEARRQRVELMVSALHRQTRAGRWRQVSVTEPLLIPEDVPLLLIPEDAPDSWPADRALRLLLTLDGSRCSEAALLPYARVSRWLKADVMLLEVVEAAVGGHLVDDLADRVARERVYLDGVRRLMRSLGVETDPLVELGRPAHTIDRIARSTHADLIAMAIDTGGRPGSVVTAVLESTDIPLLLVGNGRSS